VGRVRRRNEDAFLVADVVGGRPTFDVGIARFAVGANGALLAVSDGMGGHPAGHVASAMTLESLFRALVARAADTNAQARLVQAAEQANEEVRQAARRRAFEDMGATVTAALIEGTTAYVASVGDSRAYVLREGEIHRLTRDQNAAQIAADVGVLSPSDVAASPLRNMLAQAIGRTLEFGVAMTQLQLRARDCLLLCTDGVTNKLKDDEIRDFILGAPSLAAACKAIVDESNERGGEDNATVMCAGIGGDVPAVHEGEDFASTYQITRVGGDWPSPPAGAQV
jgi:protein phosphatase